MNLLGLKLTSNWFSSDQGVGSMVLAWFAVNNALNCHKAPWRLWVSWWQRRRMWWWWVSWWVHRWLSRRGLSWGFGWRLGWRRMNSWGLGRWINWCRSQGFRWWVNRWVGGWGLSGRGSRSRSGWMMLVVVVSWWVTRGHCGWNSMVMRRQSHGQDLSRDCEAAH